MGQGTGELTEHATTALLHSHSTPGPSKAVSRTILILCLAAGFITLLDQSMFVLAVPSMSADLQADPTAIQWILAGYSLSFGVALVPAGRLGDMVGRKRLFIFGLAIFGAFSLLAGFAHDPALVIVARLLQGLGAGALNPQVLGLLQDVFTGLARARALGLYTAAGGLAAICGPVIGGTALSLVGHDVGWRILFLANVPLVLALVVLAMIFLPGPGRKAAQGSAEPAQVSGRPGVSSRRRSIDAVGALLLGAVVITALIPTIHKDSTTVTISLSICTGAVVAFVGWEGLYARRGLTPLMLPELIRSPGYVLGTVVALANFGAGQALGAVTAFYFLSGPDSRPWLVAVILAPEAIGMLIASSLSWRFLARFGRGGLVLVTLGSLVALGAKDMAVQHFDLSSAAFLVAGIGFLHGAVVGLSYAPNQTLTLAFAPPGALGVATGFFQLSQRFSGAIAASAASGLFLAAATATQNGYREAFQHSILLCVGLLTIAVFAGATDWLRRRRATNQAATQL